MFMHSFLLFFLGILGITAPFMLGVADPFLLGVIDPFMLAPTSGARFF